MINIYTNCLVDKLSYALLIISHLNTDFNPSSIHYLQYFGDIYSELDEQPSELRLYKRITGSVSTDNVEADM